MNSYDFCRKLCGRKVSKTKKGRLEIMKKKILALVLAFACVAGACSVETAVQQSNTIEAATKK